MSAEIADSCKGELGKSSFIFVVSRWFGCCFLPRSSLSGPRIDCKVVQSKRKIWWNLKAKMLHSDEVKQSLKTILRKQSLSEHT